MSEFKCGFVTILGKANVGKSTLLNKLVGQKVSIVSPKPQTTRNKITGILNGDNYQVVFLDTPGIHKSKNQLDKFMDKSIESAKEDVDLILYIIEANKAFDEVEKIEKLAQDTPVILVINKTDETTFERLAPKLQTLNECGHIKEIVPVSALKEKNLDTLKNLILKYIPESPPYFPEDQHTDVNMRFIASEIIREKSLWLLQQEIPHGIAVVINHYIENENVTKIDATLFCERDSHKKIIIGEKGKTIKKLGEESRKALEKMLESKVYLSLWVKVKPDWREKDVEISNLGYNAKDI